MRACEVSDPSGCAPIELTAVTADQTAGRDHHGHLAGLPTWVAAGGEIAETTLITERSTRWQSGDLPVQLLPSDDVAPGPFCDGDRVD